jgi:hypothetical protein
MTDINLTKCLVAKEHLGYTTYINICNDTEKVIPWTTGDWIGTTLLIFIATVTVLACVLAMGCIAYMIRDCIR